VRLRDHVTHVVDTGGDGIPFVFLHSVATDYRMWTHVMRFLAADSRLIAYDIRGHGAASGAPTASSAAMLAEDLRDLLDHLHVENAHVCGISMGGAIAQQFAITFPERVATMTLAATFSKPLPVAERGLSGVRDGMAAQIAPTLTRWFTPAALAVNDWGVDYARTCVARMLPQHWLATWSLISKFDVFAQLGDIRIPAKVIAGEQDTACPPDTMKREIADQIPTSQFFVIPAVAHMFNLEKPDAFADILRMV
jgi:3-oxoadipate enol-lactonase